MKKTLGLLACAGALISAAAGAQSQVESPKPKPKSAQLSKVIFDPVISAGAQRVKVGTICLFAGGPLNFGSGERTLNNERYERLFSSTMKARGYSVVEKSADLFESESKTVPADILIGATFHPQTVDICDSVNGQKGLIAITVDWQIYDRAKQQVVEKVTTTGIGQVPKFNPSGLSMMLDDAFASSVKALIDQGTVDKYLGKPTA